MVGVHESDGASPARFYVGMRSDSIFVEPGDAFDVDLIIMNVNGNAVADVAIDARMVRKDWVFGGQWKEVEVNAQTCAIAFRRPGNLLLHRHRGRRIHQSAQSAR